MCIGSCIGSCLGSCAGSCCCTACNKLCGGKGSFRPYLILLVLNTILAIILRYEGGPLVLHFYAFDTPALCSEALCAGMEAVFRVAFALFLFFFLHGFLLMFKPFTKLDHLHWAAKYLIYIILLVISFAIPQPFYHDGFVHIARVISGIFLFLQVVILIDFAYSWNESWTSEEAPKHGAVLGISFLFLAGSVVLWAFYFIWFAGSDCSRNQFFVAWTIIVSVIITLLSISPVVEKGGLLPASIVTLYCTWLAYSGLQSDPSSCNTLVNQNTLQLILGLAIGTVSIAYAGYNVATSNSLFGGLEAKPREVDDAPEDEKLSSIAISEGGAGVSAGKAAKKDKDDYGSNDEEHGGEAGKKAEQADLTTEDDELNNTLIAKRNMRFHFIMAACACYMAMLLTNWGSLSSHQTFYDASTESVFIKFATQWLTQLLYVWSLIAPRIFKDRDFS
jgi:hypothetical protein